jgi:hypothetical protein
MKKTNYELVKNYQVTMNGLGFNSVKDFVDFLNLPAPESILDRQERIYLKNVVAPFWRRVNYIIKCKDDDFEYIMICVSGNGYYGYRNEHIILPDFPRDTMYKNMILEKKYTLKELGITFRERK